MKVLVVASKYLPEYTGAAYRIHTLYKKLSNLIPSSVVIPAKAGIHSMVETSQKEDIKSYGNDFSPSVVPNQRMDPGFRRDDNIGVEVLCSGIEYASAERYELDGIAIERITSTWPAKGGKIAQAVAFWRDAWAGYQAIKRKEFDVLHVAGSNPLTVAARHYAWWHKKPVLVEMVTTGSHVSQNLPGLPAPKLKSRCAVVAISGPLGEQAAKEGYVKNVWVRPNPVDTSKFFYDPAPSSRREALTPFKQGDIVLCMVAKFMPQKNQSFLLDVMEHLPERYKLVLAGPVVEKGRLAARDRAYMDEIRTKADALPGRVSIQTGFADAGELMRASDIYLMPNTHEGMGTPMLEALACGVPVVANARERAFRDLGKKLDQHPLFLAPPEPVRWASIIKALLPLREGLAEESSAMIARDYSLEATAKDYEVLLKALTSAPADGQIDMAAILPMGKKHAS